MTWYLKEKLYNLLLVHISSSPIFVNKILHILILPLLRPKLRPIAYAGPIFIAQSLAALALMLRTITGG